MTAHDGTILRRTEKKCGKCRKVSPLDMFNKDASRTDGKDAYCKTCRYEKNRAWAKSNPEKYRDSTRNTRRKIEYGIGHEEFNEILKKQGGKCAICNSKIDKKSHLDHCHETSRVRGILCQSCNLGLGRFKDNVEFLKNAIKYLETH